jgi:DNA-binding transcriptional LysR family regulator
LIKFRGNESAQLSLTSDFRLLVALDALLQTESVTEAAKRLRLSPSAMSRTLHRIRHKLGDPILARAGRGMVVTPRGVELRERVHSLVCEAQQLLSSGEEENAATSWRNFVLIVDDGYAGLLAPRLACYDGAQAPETAFHFLAEGQVDSKALGEGTADLKIGRVHSSSPELMVEHLSYSRYVGVAQAGHDLLDGPVDIERFANTPHVDILEADVVAATVDTVLAEHNLRRTVAMTTRHYTSAFSMIGQTSLVAIAPEILINQKVLMAGLRPFELPIPIAPVAIRMAWHPRSDADPAHAWLRSRIRDTLLHSGGGTTRFPCPPHEEGHRGETGAENADPGPARSVVNHGSQR